MSLNVTENALKLDINITIDHSFSLSFLTAIFPGEPGLAGFISAKDDGSGGNNWSCKTCKAPVKCHHQQMNTQLFTGRTPFLSPKQQCQGTARETKQQAVWELPQYAPAPLLPVGTEAPRTDRPQRSSRFPCSIHSHAHLCSCLTR